MMARIKALPFFVLLLGLGAVAMLVPALHAILAYDDAATARVFLYGAIIGLVLTLVLGIATQGYSPRNVLRSQLTALLAAFAALPLFFALPFLEGVRGLGVRTTFLDAWFEMVSSFTTTGATVYDMAGQLNASLHLWRALVGWMGGLLIWVTAVAILAPMNIGGFEVRARGRASGPVPIHARLRQGSDPAERLARYALVLTPIYAMLTGVLAIGLLIAGEIPIVAVTHAMAVLSTSGISAIGGLQYAASGFWGEVLIFGFMAFAISRLTFSRGLFSDDGTHITRDPEVRLAAVLVLSVTSLLFLRHFVGALEEGVTYSAATGLTALWGTLFTVMSFLTSTGFESFDWLGARDWSGLRTPGLVLVGLSLIGGGVATTAGGVKLLRVYALTMHGERELERLVHPNSVGGGGGEGRRIRRQGAYISWIFFMLFALSITGVMLALSLTGVQFETSMVLAVAAISTTGPLADVAAESPILYSGVPDSAKVVLAATMVLGRLELLALIALLNPEFWRR